jgi:hypothetical protein
MKQPHEDLSAELDDLYLYMSPRMTVHYPHGIGDRRVPEKSDKVDPTISPSSAACSSAHNNVVTQRPLFGLSERCSRIDQSPELTRFGLPIQTASRTPECWSSP